MYGTISQLKEHLGITDATQDAYLTDLMDRATDWIDTSLGRSFGGQTVTDELYERQGRVIWLRNPAVTAVTAVKVRDTRAESYETLTSTTYEWTTTGRLELPLCYTFVQVSYTWASDIPKVVEQATIELAAAGYRAKGENGAVKSERVGDLSITYADAASVNPTILSAINAYRLRSV